MVRVFVLALVAFSLVVGPVMAQDGASDRRHALAERLMDLSMGEEGNLRKLADQQVQQALSEIGSMPEEQATWMRNNVPNLVLRMVDRLTPRLIDLYAETYSLEELEAQVAFYETPIGRSVATKSAQLGASQMEVIMEGQQAYLTELLTKFCAEFECNTDQTAAKPATR